MWRRFEKHCETIDVGFTTRGGRTWKLLRPSPAAKPSEAKREVLRGLRGGRRVLLRPCYVLKAQFWTGAMYRIGSSVVSGSSVLNKPHLGRSRTTESGHRLFEKTCGVSVVSGQMARLTRQ